MSEVEIILALLLAVVALITLASRLHVPYPILLVLGGVTLGFVPALPPIQVDPEVVFLIFVPPLVFAAAFFMSWRDAGDPGAASDAGGRARGTAATL